MPIAAGVIFLATMAGVVARPFGRGEAWWTTAGALLVLGIGAVSPAAAWHALTAQGNVFLFLFGLMSIAGLADAAGFFDLAGAGAVALARGSGRALLVCVFGVGALVTAFLSNDATALILTPVVYGLVTRLRLRPLPYLLAATFVADTASLLLPVSNPINVLIGGRLQLTLLPYLRHFLLAALVVILVNVALFLAIFWRLGLAQAREHISLTVLIYVAGLFVLVAALERAGLTAGLAHALRDLVPPGPSGVVAGTLSAAIGSNGVNNVPAATVLLSASSGLHPGARAPFLAGTLLGADLGPNLTPVGSLSTMLWLVAVRRRGVQVSPLDYLKLGAVTTPVLLLAGGALVAASYR